MSLGSCSPSQLIHHSACSTFQQQKGSECCCKMVKYKWAEEFFFHQFKLFMQHNNGIPLFIQTDMEFFIFYIVQYCDKSPCELNLLKWIYLNRKSNENCVHRRLKCKCHMKPWIYCDDPDLFVFLVYFFGLFSCKILFYFCCTFLVSVSHQSFLFFSHLSSFNLPL